MQASDPESKPIKKSHPQMNAERRDFSRYFLHAYVLLIVYVSLSPFSGWQTPDNGAFYFLTAPWPKYITASDVIANVLAYVPLGMLLFERTRRHLNWAAAVAAAILAGFLLSLSMEALQSYLPIRIPSLVDLIANGLGTMVGAFAAARMGRSSLARRIVRWHNRTFTEGSNSEFGEVLLAIWLFMQLNPSIPFFAAGTISLLSAGSNANHSEPLYLLPQGLAVALNLCGFGLFISVLLKPRVRALRFVILVIAWGAFLKMLAAGVMLKSSLMLDWFGKEAFVGVIGGLVLLLGATRLTHRWRIYFAAMLILAGGLLAKIAAIYDALFSIVSVFNWPYGQLFNFTSLTLFLNEIWPFVTLVYLLMGFNRLPSSDLASRKQPAERL